MADSLDAAQKGVLGESVTINSLWVTLSAVLVLLMLAGLLCLEAGMSRMKNVGTLVPKALISMAVGAIAYYACGFAFAFGNGDIIGSTGFLLQGYGDPQKAFGIMGLSDALIESKWLFQCAFACVTLGIVWGSTLERIKFHAHVIFAVVFVGFVYPLASHWVFGGGWLQTNIGMQDFAGSTVVHLIGATGALAALLLLGPRVGKYGPDGKPRAIPGHSMPLVGLGVLILWLGWFGFNPGSTLGAMGGRFAEVVVVTNLAAAAGVIAAVSIMYLKTRTIDIGMAGNGAIAGLVGITAPSGYVEYWAAPIIGAIAGVIVVYGIFAIEKVIDDPVGATSAHGLAGIWGTLACGIFTSPRLAEFNEVGDPGLWYSGSFSQLGAQALGIAVAFSCVFAVSYTVFFVIKKTIGLRVSAEEEDAGLDISEHGMYGYPEQFIPQPEYSTGLEFGGPPATAKPAAAPAQMTATETR
jgi:Amt family ammonium transporter